MKTIRENLITLKALIERTEVEVFNLGAVTKDTACGSAHCVFGWAAASNLFPDLTVNTQGTPSFQGRPIDYDTTQLDHLFGTDASLNLFMWAGGGAFDSDLGYPEYSGGVTWESAMENDLESIDYTPEQEKALAIARIERQLEDHP